jgi:hypothetical protein
VSRERSARDCRGCTHFDDTAQAIARDLPGLAIFASIDSAAWGSNGLCRRHDRLTNGRRRCADYLPR